MIINGYHVSTSPKIIDTQFCTVVYLFIILASCRGYPYTTDAWPVRDDDTYLSHAFKLIGTRN